MKNFFGTKPTAADTAKKPVIRRETVQIQVNKPAVRALPRSASGQRPAPAQARPRDPNRFTLTERSGARPSHGKGQRKTLEKKIAHSRGIKRALPTSDVHFSSDEEDSSDFGGSDSDASRKRIKSSVSSVESLTGPRRQLVARRAFKDHEPQKFIHGADATSGQYAAKFQNPWEAEDFETVELQYPSQGGRERFEIKWPRHEKDDYKPMEDIVQTIRTICLFYLPDELSDQYTSDDGGFERRFSKAWQRQSVPDFIKIVADFNAVLHPLIDDGTIESELGRKTHLHLDWMKRILEQIQVRTVSPKAEILNAYKNGSDNVYGELLPRFVNDIVRRTKLSHEHVFIDLGSGVGNVVLQAALEVGCESWGIEMMPNPCALAEMQRKEFVARSQLWGLDVGSVNLLRGDMTRHPEIPKILHRADVVLVNNQAFTPALNDQLINMFLDLKIGAQIVSLKPFVPVSHKMAVRNIDSVVNQFVQKEYEYFSDSVSWSHYGNGQWYVATKDLRPLNAFRKKMGLDVS